MLISFLCAIWLCVESTVAKALNGGDLSEVQNGRSQSELQSVNVSSSINKRDAGILQVSLSSDGGSYYSIIEAGNISFRVALDTASSDLWILSSACSSGACKGIPSYPLSYASPTFATVNDNQTAFNLSFADGSISSGFLARESIELGNFTLPDQVIGLVNSTNVTLNNEISGLLGLGFPRLSQFSSLAVNATPLVNSLAQNGLLDYPLFGLSLTRNGSGSISIGAFDADVVKNGSQIEWHKVVPFSPFTDERNTSSYLQWVLRLTSFGVNETTLITPEPTYPNITTQSLALLDVGTNGIFGPYQDVSRIFDAMDGARLVDADGQWAMPCDGQVVLSFNFGQGNFTLQPTDYLIAPTSGDPTLCLAWPRAIAENGDGIDWQLGTPFLRTVYSIFSFGIDNKEPPMIGLYPLSSNVSVLAEDVSAISSFFKSASTTAATTLPNFLLSTVTPPVPTYIFNTSVPAVAGDIVSADLGTSTYSPILNSPTVNASALPSITAPPTALTLIITDASGMIITSTSVLPTTTVVLGQIPGESGAWTIHIPLLTLLSCAFVTIIVFAGI